MVTRGADGRLHSPPPVVLSQLAALHGLADEATALKARLAEAEERKGAAEKDRSRLTRKAGDLRAQLVDATGVFEKKLYEFGQQVASRDARIAAMEKEQAAWSERMAAVERERDAARAGLAGGA